MTLRLILIRHAKSDWNDQRTADHARPLNGRGRRDAPAIGRWLAMRGALPDQVLCSDARRTLETWSRIAGVLPDPPAVTPVAALYHAPAATMLAVLRSASGTCVAMIGHNPGIGDFAGRIVAHPPDHARFADYPTAATAVIGFDATDWRDIVPGTGRVAAFVTPHDLADR